MLLTVGFAVAAGTIAWRDSTTPDKNRQPWRWLRTALQRERCTGWEQTKGWTIDNGAIYCDRQPADIFGVLKHTAKPLPQNFELVFEWKVKRNRLRRSISPVISSWAMGWFPPTQPIPQNKSSTKFRSKLMYQTSGNLIVLETAPVNVGTKPGNRLNSGGSISVSPAADAERPAGEWNESRIISNGDGIQHWLNGTKLIDVRLPELKKQNPGGADFVDRWTRFRANRHGVYVHIEWGGSPAWYRNFKIRRID